MSTPFSGPGRRTRRTRCTKSTPGTARGQRFGSGVDRTPMPGEGGPWVQVDLAEVSLPVAVEDIVAALWLAAETGDLNPADLGPGESFQDMAQAVVLYLLVNDHAGILTARHQLAGLAPGTQLHDLAEQLRGYAAELFLPPALDVDIPDNLGDLGDGFEKGDTR